MLGVDHYRLWISENLFDQKVMLSSKRKLCLCCFVLKNDAEEGGDYTKLFPRLNEAM